MSMRNIAYTYLGDLHTNNIVEVPENFSAENNVASSLSVINPITSSDPSDLAHVETNDRVRTTSYASDCFLTIQGYFTRKFHNLSRSRVSSEQTADIVRTNVTPLTPGHLEILPQNPYPNETYLEMSSPPPSGSHELLVDEESRGCLQSASAFSRQARDWCRRKLQSVGSVFPASNNVIELTPTNTDNIFMVNAESIRLPEVDHETDWRHQSRQVDLDGKGCFPQIAVWCQNIRSRVFGQSRRNASTRLESALDWSVLQAYNTVAFSTCSVPYRLELDDDGKYAIKSYALQKILWVIQMGFVIAGLCRRMSLFARDIMHLDQPDPFEYMRMAIVIVTVLATLLFIKPVASSSGKLLQIHQDFEMKNNNNLPNLHSRKVKLIKCLNLHARTCFLLYCYILTALVIDVATYMYRFSGELDLSPATVLHAFSCFSRETYLWQDVDECGDGDTVFVNVSDVPYSEILLGLVGMLTFICESLFDQSLVLVLLVCSITLLIPAWYATCDDRFAATGSYQLTTKHDLLTELSENLSRYAGLTLALQLVNVAFALSVSLKMAIMDRNVAFLTFTITTTVNLASYLIASTSSMLIDELEEEFTNPENRNELPRDGVAATAFFHNLFRKSLGIGYRGLFVLNFRFLFSYLGIIGTFIMVLYEAAKETLGQRPTV